MTQKDEAGIQLNFKKFDFMAATSAYDDIEKVTANCNLQDNLQHASTSGTQSDKSPVRTQTNQLSLEQGGGTVEQNSLNVKETHAYHESLFHNLAAEVEKVNLFNCKMNETNAELTTKLARYKNQEKCFEISQEKYEKLKGDQNWFDTLLIPLLSEYKPKDKEDHGDDECDT
nr:hypothetical protein [Tanacetum cinerariifolium]